MLAAALIIVGFDMGAWAFFGRGVECAGRLCLGCALVEIGAVVGAVGAWT